MLGFLGIVLGILKLLGLILLWVLLILLILIVLILVVPIRYRLVFNADPIDMESDEDSVPATYHGKVKVSWLFQFIRVLALLDVEPSEKPKFVVKVKLLFISVFTLPKKKKDNSSENGESLEAEEKMEDGKEEAKKQANDEAKEQEEKQDSSVGSKVEPKVDQAINTTIESKLDQAIETTIESKLDQVIETTIESTVEPQEKVNEVESDIRVYREESDAEEGTDAGEETDAEKEAETEGKAEKLKSSISDKIDKLFETKEKIDKKIKILESKTSEKAFSKLMDVVKKILLHIIPKKFNADVEFGSGDGESTGKAYALYSSLLYPKYHETIQFQPDFTRKVFLGKINIQGRIVLGYIVIQGLRLILDSNIRKTIRRLKK